MVGDDHPVDALGDRAGGVVGVEDSLEHDRERRALAQERERLPGQRGARVDLGEALYGGASAARSKRRQETIRVRAGQLDQRAQCGQRRAGLRLVGAGRRCVPRDQVPEHRVARVLSDALAVEERQVRALEVARAPAEHRRVERDDDRAAAAALGPRREALDERVRAAPVELEPVRRVLEDPGHALHRLRGLVREHHRGARVAGGAGDGAVGLGVREFEHADRREQERVRQPAPEQLDARVAPLDVAQHSRDDPPVVERRAVGGQRPFVTGARGYVGERLGPHALLRGRFEPARVEWNVWSPAADAVEIDLCLAPHADHAAGSHHTSTVGRSQGLCVLREATRCRSHGDALPAGAIQLAPGETRHEPCIPVPEGHRPRHYSPRCKPPAQAPNAKSQLLAPPSCPRFRSPVGSSSWVEP